MRSRLLLTLMLFGMIAFGRATPGAQSGKVYQGSVSENVYPPLDPRNFPQEDPRVVEPVQAPAALQGNQSRCIPPNRNWKLLAQYENNCLYAAPLPPVKRWYYRNNIVVPKSYIFRLDQQGSRCGADPWDDSKAVCTPPVQQNPPRNGAGGFGWRYGPYTYNIPPSMVPTPLRIGLSNGTCVPDDPRSPNPHITCQPVPPNCSKGVAGGYDPSANPACEQSGTNAGFAGAGYGNGQIAQNNTPRIGVPYPCGRMCAPLWCETNGEVISCVNPGRVSQQQPPQSGFNTALMLQLAARMDQIVGESGNSVSVAFDHFFAGLATWASRTLKFLAQKPGEPVGQMAQAIARYLTNNYNQNDQALRGAAMQAIAEMQSDPARFWGENLPNLLPLPRFQALQEIRQIEAGAQRISAVAREAEIFGNEFNAARENAPNLGGQFGAAPAPACFAENACVPTAIAQDQLWAEGTNIGIQGVYPLSGQNLAMDGSQVQQLLRQRYRGAAALNNPYFNPVQRMALQQGIPLAGSVQDIKNAVLAGGNGSRGIVFIRPEQGMGHAFNVRNFNGAIQFWDATQKMDGSLWFSLPIKDIFFYPTR